jgi:porphobilinogen deaminase
VSTVGIGLSALDKFMQLLLTPAGKALAEKLILDHVPQDKLDAAVASMKDAPPPKAAG